MSGRNERPVLIVYTSFTQTDTDTHRLANISLFVRFIMSQPWPVAMTNAANAKLAPTNESINFFCSAAVGRWALIKRPAINKLLAARAPIESRKQVTRPPIRCLNAVAVA